MDGGELLVATDGSVGTSWLDGAEKRDDLDSESRVGKGVSCSGAASITVLVSQI